MILCSCAEELKFQARRTYTHLLRLQFRLEKSMMRYFHYNWVFQRKLNLGLQVIHRRQALQQPGFSNSKGALVVMDVQILLMLWKYSILVEMWKYNTSATFANGKNSMRFVFYCSLYFIYSSVLDVVNPCK